MVWVDAISIAPYYVELAAGVVSATFARCHWINPGVECGDLRRCVARRGEHCFFAFYSSFCARPEQQSSGPVRMIRMLRLFRVFKITRYSSWTQVLVGLFPRVCLVLAREASHEQQSRRQPF